MQQTLLAALCWALALTVSGQPPAGYYDPAQGLTGPALRQALYTVIDGHLVLTNSSLWGAFESTDQKQDGRVWDMYSDVPGGTPPYTFTFGVDQCGTYNSEGDCFNREHTFPQSWFNSAAPMSTDLFHVYPTDAWVNQQRGNWPYGTVAQADWTSQNGGQRGSCTWPGCSGTVFEPIDAYKGDLARGFFYMLTRYMPDAVTWPAPILAQGEFVPWAESLLLAWHQQDPVSPKEVARNNAVYALQNNRNPYIDNPQWVEAIWGPNAGVEDVLARSIRIWSWERTLTVEMDDFAPADLVVLDAVGRVVLLRQLTAQREHVELPAAPGVYVALVQQGAQRTAVRVVK